MLWIFRDESEPEMIEDTTAEKPEDWLDDEPELVPDESAEKPEDWYVHWYTVYADVCDVLLQVVWLRCWICESWSGSCQEFILHNLL